jgi:hypothetical protein
MGPCQPPSPSLRGARSSYPRANVRPIRTLRGLTERSCCRVEVGVNRDRGCDSNQSVNGFLILPLARDMLGDNDTATRKKQHKPTTCSGQPTARCDAGDVEMRRCNTMDVLDVLGVFAGLTAHA